MSFLQKLANLFSASTRPIPPQPPTPILTIPERYEELRATVDRPQETPVPQPTPQLPAPAKKRVPQPQPEPDVLTAKQLAAALDLCALIAERHSNVPALTCCLLSEGKVAATNLEQYIEVELPLLHIAKPICVNLMQLRGAVVRMGKATLTIDIIEDDFLLLNGVLRLPTIAAEEFPGLLPERLGKCIGAAFLIPARWSDVMVGMTYDESRPTLCGVGIDLSAGLCAASNGHHLYLTPMERQEIKLENLPVIPARAATVVARLPSATGQLYHRIFDAEERKILTGETGDVNPPYQHRREQLDIERRRAQFAVFTSPGVKLWSHLPDAPFPDYTQVVPKKWVAQIECPKAALRELFAACAPLLAALKATRATIGLQLEQRAEGLRAICDAREHGKVEQTLPAWGMPLDHRLGLNLTYLSMMAKTLRTDPLVLQIAGFGEQGTADEHMVTHPIVCSDETLQVVLMPMRVCSDTPVKVVSREQQPAEA